MWQNLKLKILQKPKTQNVTEQKQIKKWPNQKLEMWPNQKKNQNVTKLKIKNPAHGRRQLSRPMRIVEPTQIEEVAWFI